MTAVVDNKAIRLAELAKNDGLSEEDFKNWFKPLSKGSLTKVELVIIHFTKFRY